MKLFIIEMPDDAFKDMSDFVGLIYDEDETKKPWCELSVTDQMKETFIWGDDVEEIDLRERIKVSVIEK